MSASWLVWLGPWLFAVLWATGFIVARGVAGDADPLTFLSLRFALSTALFVAIVSALGLRWPRDPRVIGHNLLAGGLLHGLYLGPVYWAQGHGLPVGIMALIASLQPLLTACLSMPLLGERLSRRAWLGIALGFCGVGLVVTPKLTLIDTAGVTLPNVIIGACGVLSLTLATFYQRRFVAGIDLRTGSAIQYLGAGLVVGAGALLLEQGRVVWTVEFAIWLAWAVLVLSLGAATLLIVLVRRGAVAGVASLMYLVTPVATVMAHVLFDEPITGLQIAGIVIASAGVALVTRKRPDPPAPPASAAQ